MLPRTRREDAAFRTRIRQGQHAWTPIWEKTDDDGMVVDVFATSNQPTQTVEGYRLLWFHSVVKSQCDAMSRLDRIERTLRKLTEFQDGDGGRKRQRGDRVAAVENDSAQPCSSLRGEDRGDSPDSTPLSEEVTGVHSDMEMWSEIRREVLTGVLSQRAALAKYGIGWRTLKKMLAHDEPPGYRQSKPKLDAFLPLLRQMLEYDGNAPKKQKHTARGIFDRLRDEHGYGGCETVVKDAVREWRISRREVFLPLSHPPGEPQVDFGEATIRIAGQETKAVIFVMTLPYSGAIFVQAFPKECTETFMEGASPGVRGVRRRAEADQLRQLSHRRHRGAQGPGAEAHSGVPQAPEPFSVHRALLPRASCQREGARGAIAGNGTEKVPRAGAPRQFDRDVQPASHRGMPPGSRRTNQRAIRHETGAAPGRFGRVFTAAATSVRVSTCRGRHRQLGVAGAI